MLQYTHASVQDFTQVCELFLVLFSIISIYHNSVVTVEEEEDDVSLRKVHLQASSPCARMHRAVHPQAYRRQPVICKNVPKKSKIWRMGGNLATGRRFALAYQTPPP